MIDLETIFSTAKLARLRIEPDEAKAMVTNFESILGYFNEIESVDVSSVEPLFSPFEMDSELRDDKVTQAVSPDEILKSAPSLRDKEYLVPPVVS